MGSDTMPVAFSALAFDGPAWLGTARKAAREHFKSSGYPTRKDEAWRYTDLRPLHRLEFSPPLADAALGLSRDGLSAWLSPSAAGSSAVFVNGVFSARLSHLESTVGLRITSLAESLAVEPELIRPHLGHLRGTPEGGFVALNTAGFQDGALIRVGRNKHIAAPVELLFLTTEDERPVESMSRALILADEGSSVTVLERHVCLCGGPSIKNAVTEIIPQRDALVRHVKVQQDSDQGFHLGTAIANPGPGANVESHVVTIGGAVARNAVHVTLGHERSACTLRGIYAAAGKQSLDHYTHIDHSAAHCTSRELYKGIVSDAAVGSFLGRILIREGAIKTSTDQQCRTLLLSEKAAANAKPSLEIDNDDVRATHGAAIGQLDADALFYLRSRGIDMARARGLLIEAFAREVLDELPVAGLGDSLIEAVLSRVHEVLH